MTTSTYIITIDGPASSGKSSVAQRCAEKLSYTWISTGKLYRLCGLMAHKRGIPMDTNALETKTVQKKLALLVAEMQNVAKFEDYGKILTIKGKDISPLLLWEEVGAYAALLGKNANFRQALLPWQRCLAQNVPTPGAIFDGRDMGTVVFKDLAKIKFYLTANTHVRALRRWHHQHPNRDPQPEEMKALKAKLELRDNLDMTRASAPLKPAEDALILDTSNMTLEEVIEWVSDRIMP